MASPQSLIDFAGSQEGLAPIRLAFDEPEEELVARAPAEVLQTLRLAEERARQGFWCVGYLRYEAASAFDAKLEVYSPDGPLVYFGVHRRPVAWPDMDRDIDYALDWSRAVDRQKFDAALSRLHGAIEAGEVYQVNYTSQLNADYLGDPFDLFCALHRAQPKSNAAFFATGDEQILSVSPELFFNWDGRTVTCAPMKGTAARGATPELDAINARALHECAKERAENVMIVDLIRNDLSRVAQLGSVQVSRLFECQAWPTVWQMVSKVVAQTRPDTTLADVFTALFPCGSITGAPKRRAMHWIKKLEPQPRGVYCGAVGVIQPGGAARFNVPIRTVTLRSGGAACGIGSGITWSSLAHREWSEWEHKASFLQQASRPFELLQTLRVHAGECLHLEMHLDRMEAAAGHFGFKFDLEEVRCHILDATSRASIQGSRLRVLVNCRGEVKAELHALPPAPLGRPLVRLAARPVDAPAAFLRHKTTRREHLAVFESQLADAFDCLLWNARGELTEFTRGSVVVERADGQCVTPALSCGLLDGVGRARALQAGQVKENIVTIGELATVRRMWFVNSLRGWIEVRPETLAVESSGMFRDEPIADGKTATHA